MNDLGPSESSKPIATRSKANNERNKQSNGGAVAANEEKTSDILKLDIDCCEEAFDYLPIEDLVSVGKTCKRLQRVAGHYFQQNHLHHSIYKSKAIRYKNYDVESFVPFIQNIWIHGKAFRYFYKARSNFRQLKHILIVGIPTTDMHRLNKISVEKLVSLHVSSCVLSKFHEIIDQCTKLSHLELSYCSGDFNWLNRTYPTLKHFTFCPPLKFWDDIVDRFVRLCKSFFIKGAKRATSYIEGIPMFLELNPNIRTFATSSEFFWKYRNKMMALNIKLDVLAIRQCPETVFSAYVEIDLMFDLFNELHERGFYRKLHLYFNEEIENQEIINRLATVNGLVKLVVYAYRDIPLTYSALKHLEDLHVFAKSVADLEMLPDNLVNLKRFLFCSASMNDVIPFISRSVEMQKIYVGTLETGVHFNKDTAIIDLLALNREREQLPDAQKITLYVEENIYLATKWAMKGSDFSLIRLKRNFNPLWENSFNL